VTAGDGRRRPLPVDPTAYTVQDGAGTVRSVLPRWRWTLEGLDEVPHAAVVALQALGEVLAAAGGSGEDLAELSEGVDRRLQDLGRRVGPTTGLVEAVGAHDPLVHAVESVDSLLSAAGRAVATEVVSPDEGVVALVATSGGGVPKHALGHAEVGPSGLVGDRQATRRHHGRPSQALCLWSAEVIGALADEGHPVGPGAAGENLLLAGVDWRALRPGVRLAFGDGAVAELTGWADPCTTIASSFSGGSFERIDHGGHPGWSRAYAAVVCVGRVAPGDAVRVLP
jgi:MOSC domain-containing protein YiiM